MKVLILFSLLAIKVPTYCQADFSGNWMLNPYKSEFNNTPGSPAATNLVVEQSGKTVTFQRDNLGKETLKIDSTAQIEITSTDVNTIVSMKLSLNKQGIIETRTYVYPDDHTEIVAAKKIRTWSLSLDKKTLTIQDHIETTKEGLSYDMLLIYDRQ